MVFDIERYEALNFSLNYLNIQSLRTLKSEVISEVIIYPRSDNEFELCWKFIIESEKPPGDFEIIIGGSSNGMYVIHADDMILDLYKNGSGIVFDPNPIQQTGNRNLRDRNDIDFIELSSAYKHVILRDLLNDSNKLRGLHVDTDNLRGGLNVNKAISQNGTFYYDRSNPEFNEVMAYYHIDSMQRYLNSLGYKDENSINSFQKVNANWNNADNSFFSPFNKGLFFGIGGVDDAEDGEIIIHEYGHALFYDQRPCVTNSRRTHGRAMSEGFGDILSILYFLPEPYILNNATACIGDWDSTSYSNNNITCLRRVDGQKKYPNDLTGQEHDDGEIWSGVLWDIFLGIQDKDTTLKLILEEHFITPCGNHAPTMR